jgi:hypothetical protein
VKINGRLAVKINGRLAVKINGRLAVKINGRLAVKNEASEGIFQTFSVETSTTGLVP